MPFDRLRGVPRRRGCPALDALLQFFNLFDAADEIAEFVELVQSESAVERVGSRVGRSKGARSRRSEFESGEDRAAGTSADCVWPYEEVGQVRLELAEKRAAVASHAPGAAGDDDSTDLQQVVEIV